jgi:hypothetical protein
MRFVSSVQQVRVEKRLFLRKREISRPLMQKGLKIFNVSSSSPNSYEKQATSEQEDITVLRTVPHENGFHFYTALGSYTGETATSLDVFERKIQVVPAVSLIFHLQRGDFQKWIEDTLGDAELAKRIARINVTRPAEDLRKELLAIVQTRISELRRELSHHLGQTHE